MSSAWAGFAKHGYPSNPHLTKWPAFVTTGSQFMVNFNTPKATVVESKSAENGKLFERCNAWGDAHTGAVMESKAYEFCYSGYEKFVKEWDDKEAATDNHDQYSHTADAVSPAVLQEDGDDK